jgi:X-X-X-Leu-X-X-Gly heptad repeat protein
MSRTMFAAIVLATAALAAALSFALTTGAARADGGITPYASGSQQISSGPGVYAQTADEYAGSWSWTQQSASYDYYWYIFQSNGTLALSGHKSLGGGDSKNLTPNIYYFKGYNNEPSGSGRINVLSGTYCC